jgi:signal transduction histidine kinase
MGLKKFLVDHRKAILKLTLEKTNGIAGSKGSSELLRVGLPLFYEQLVKVLEQKLQSKPSEDMILAAAAHGRELLRLGYSLSHVVHAYGAMCQAITQYATEKGSQITSDEFNILNRSLDIAIASAVSEYQYRSNEVSEMGEVKRLGFLAHELRNALSSATVAHEMIKKGFVGTGGSTATVLETNLARMRNLIDRSLSEVRMRSDPDLMVEKFRLSDLFDQIVITARFDAKPRNIILECVVESILEIETDRQFLLSAVANLVQNAVKFTKDGSKVYLRGSSQGEKIIIEIEDQCDGIEEEKITQLFKPFYQGTGNRSGLGLGLPIVQRAVKLLQGEVNFTNTPGVGCTFTIELPKTLVFDSNSRQIVQGKDAIQPDLLRKD